MANLLASPIADTDILKGNPHILRTSLIAPTSAVDSELILD